MLNFFPHSNAPLHTCPIIIYNKSKNVLHSQHELKYAALTALSLETMGADKTNVDRTN